MSHKQEPIKPTLNAPEADVADKSNENTQNLKAEVSPDTDKRPKAGPHDMPLGTNTSMDNVRLPPSPAVLDKARAISDERQAKEDRKHK